MPGVNHSRDITRQVRSHTHRIEDQERKIDDRGRSDAEESYLFSVVGDMKVIVSGPKRARRGGQIVATYFDADDVGTGVTTFRLLVNGSPAGSSVTVAAGDTEDTPYIGNVRVPSGARVQLEITAAGMHVGAVIEFVAKG